jgi:hypothetical protein
MTASPPQNRETDHRLGSAGLARHHVRLKWSSRKIEYLPKGTDLSVHSAAHLDRVAAELNERPRQTLGWQTPKAKMNELLLR